MDSPERTLVIFLSVALFLFLVLGIIVLIKLIQIANQARKIGEKVDNITDKAGAVVDVMSKMAPAAVFGRIFSIFKTKTSRKAKSERE
jgi:hypothetical protein